MEMIQQYIGEVITAAIGLALWALRERSLKKVEIEKAKAEAQGAKSSAKSMEANAIEAMQRAYDIYVEHNNSKLNELELELGRMRSKLNESDQHWKAKLNQLDKKWQAKYASLEKEFEDYKKSRA